MRNPVFTGLMLWSLGAAWAQQNVPAPANQPARQSAKQPPAGAPSTKSAPVPAKQAAPGAAPAWIEKSLRTRVEAMLLARKEGSFQKAYDFVAPDSRDYFFQMEKTTISSYKVDEIQWSDKFTRALVRLSTVHKTHLMGIPTEVELPGKLEEAWKNVGGRWMWWHDPKLDRTGLLAIPTSSTQSAAAAPAEGKKPPVPSDVSPAAVAAAAQTVGPSVMIDKSVIQFTEGVAGSDEVVFTNTNNGEIRVQAEVLFQPKGYSIAPTDTWLKPGEKTTFKVQYAPGEGVLTNNIRVRVYVEPFEKFYVMPVRFNPAPVIP